MPGESSRLRIRVQPGASRTACAGYHGEELKIRLQAPPVDGKANQALIEFMAAALGLRRSQVQLASGDCSRSKTLDIALSDAELCRRVAALLPPVSTDRP